jgi:hypothetical protein
MGTLCRTRGGGLIQEVNWFGYCHSLVFSVVEALLLAEEAQVR